MVTPDPDGGDQDGLVVDDSDYGDIYWDAHRPGWRWEDCDAAEAWSYGWEAWTRVRLGRTPRPWSEYDWDDSDSLKQIATMRRVADEYQRRKAEAANDN